jgi:hypothetical protein
MKTRLRETLEDGQEDLQDNAITGGEADTQDRKREIIQGRINLLTGLNPITTCYFFLGGFFFSRFGAFLFPMATVSHSAPRFR